MSERTTPNTYKSPPNKRTELFPFVKKTKINNKTKPWEISHHCSLDTGVGPANYLQGCCNDVNLFEWN